MPGELASTEIGVLSDEDLPAGYRGHYVASTEAIGMPKKKLDPRKLPHAIQFSEQLAGELPLQGGFPSRSSSERT